MQYWLVKSEPETYSWDRFVALGRDHWDGVRNYQARNNLAAMQPGDLVLFYHSGEAREVVGLARVSKAAYPDPTTDDGRWLAVELEALQPLPKPVTLAQIKSDSRLASIALIRQSRLSVMPLQPGEFDTILALGQA